MQWASSLAQHARRIRRRHVEEMFKSYLRCAIIIVIEIVLAIRVAIAFAFSIVAATISSNAPHTHPGALDSPGRIEGGRMRCFARQLPTYHKLRKRCIVANGGLQLQSNVCTAVPDSPSENDFQWLSIIRFVGDE